MDTYFSAHESNLQVVFSHLVADAIYSLLMTFSSFLLTEATIGYTDPLFSLLLSALLFIALIPICKSTGSILLQGKPLPTQGAFDRALKVLTLYPIAWRELTGDETKIAYSVFLLCCHYFPSVFSLFLK